MTAYFLTSARLGFRHWTADDLPLATALWTDPDVTRYLGGAFTPQQVRDRLALEMERQRTFGIQYWPIFDLASGAHAGCAGLRPFHDEPHVCEVGVHIARLFWSGRYGEEAARAVITHAFDTLHLAAVTAAHNPDNANSRALIERLGFRFTHLEPWGPQDQLHPFYRLEANASERGSST